jgi:integrase
VFTFKGKPIEQVSTAAWYKALGRAGIENFRWHDLRHTWASWHVQGGTPLNVLQELGGWASYSMVQRYAHFAADHLAPWADRLANRGTNPSQPQTDQRPA